MNKKTLFFLSLILFFSLTSFVGAAEQPTACVESTCEAIDGEYEYYFDSSDSCSGGIPTDTDAFVQWHWIGPGGSTRNSPRLRTALDPNTGEGLLQIYHPTPLGYYFDESLTSFFSTLSCSDESECCWSGILSGERTAQGTGECAGHDVKIIFDCVQTCDSWCKQQTYTGDDGQEHNYLSGQCAEEEPEKWWEEGGGYGFKRELPEEENVNLLAALNPFAPSETSKKAEVTDCKDNFKRGSVKFEQVDIGSYEVKAGENISLKGVIANKNSFPLAEGMVFAKIHRKDDQSSRDRLIDEFVAENNINLWPGEKKEFSFVRRIPENSIGGEYVVSLYFSGSGHFQISGLTFMPKLAEKAVRIEVEGKEKGFWIDGDRIEVNGIAVKSPTHVPVIPKRDASFSFPLVSTLESGEAEISADIYNFDSLKEENRIKNFHQERQVSLSSEEQILEFDFSGIDPGSYVLKVSAEGEKQNSLLSLRFTLPGDTARFLHSSLSSFPLKRGEEFSLNSCFANATDMSIYFDDFPGRAVVRLEDKDSGEVLAEMVYEGEVLLKPTGLKQEFRADGRSQNLVLISQIYNAQGELLDEVRTDYNLDSFSKIEEEKSYTLQIILIGLGVIVIIVAIYFVIRKRPKKAAIALLILAGLAGTVAIHASLTGTASFECRGGDQACCQYRYDEWQDLGINWESIKVDLPLMSLFSEDPVVEKMSNSHPLVEGGTVTNMSSEDELTGDFNSPEGDFQITDLFFGTPPINWVDNIGTDGTPVYYSDPDRVCSDYEDVDDLQCPPDTPNFVGDDANDFASWCNIQKDISYLASEESFALPTYTVSYTSFGIIPTATYGYNSGACVGTQVTCEREMTITTDDSKLICSLESSEDSCTTEGTGSCSLKGVEIESSCNPREEAEGLVEVTINQDFDCFSYLDRGVFVQMEDGAEHKWENKNNAEELCGPFGLLEPEKDCYCEYLNSQKKVENQECHSLHYPLKMENFSGDTSELRKTYTVEIAKSDISLDKINGEDFSGGEITIGELGNVGYEFTYSDMYPGSEGRPVFSEVDCETGGSYNDDGICSSEEDNNPGTCSLSCNYSSEPSGTFKVRIENEEKFAELEIPIVFDEQHRPEARNLGSSRGTGCWDDTSVYNLSWDFFDEDGDEQQAYHIQIDDDSNFSDCETDEGCIDEGVQESDITHKTIAGLEPSTSYRWRIRVQDDSQLNLWSEEWSESSFNTSALYPRPDFSYRRNEESPILCDDSSCTGTPCFCGSSPLSLQSGETITVTENNTENCPDCSYEWSTDKDSWVIDPNDQFLPVPESYTYSELAEDTLWLEATSLGKTCKIGLKIGVGVLRLPEWVEILPF